MDVFTAASHHDVLVLVIQMSVLLVAARGLGELAQRFNQPAVIGEIMAGILLGPTLLSGLVPFLGEWIVPQTEVQGYLIEVISLLGAMFLLIITGLETDIPLIKRHAKSALGIAAGGLILPFVTGYALAHYLPDSLLADPDQRLVFKLFIATAMSISSIPVIAKVLMDLNLIRRDLGQTILAAGMVDDTTAWILLSVVLGIASGHAVTPGGILSAVGKIAAFMLLSFTLGRWVIRRLLNHVQDRMVSRDRILTLVVVVAFLFGAIAQAIQIEAVLGAFVAGIIFGTLPRLPRDVIHQLESIALGIFAPVFFGVAGLKVNVVSLLDPHLMAMAALVLLVAIFGKLVGAYGGGRLVGLDHWNALAIGSALNARGAVEIIIATIGLSMGILSQDMYSIIVLMAMVTSLMAPSMLKWSVGKIEMGEEERERLQKEEMAAQSLVANIHRVLMPVRRWEGEVGRMSIRSVEAQLMERLGSQSELSLTLMTVINSGQERAEFQQYLKELSGLFTQKEIVTRVVEHDDPKAAILEEAQKDYDLVVLGATRGQDGEVLGTTEGTLFNPLVDEVVRMAPCPTMVVQAKQDLAAWKPRRILVPTNGTLAAERAAELAFYIAAEDMEVVILNVALREVTRVDYQSEQRMAHRLRTSTQLVRALVKLGKAQKVQTRGEVVEGDAVDDIISRWSRDESIDLIVLGTGMRPGSRRLFFGEGVEKILANAACPVVIINT